MSDGCRVDLSLSIEYEQTVHRPDLVADLVARALIESELSGVGLAPAFHPDDSDIADAMRPQILEIRCGDTIRTEPIWDRIRNTACHDTPESSEMPPLHLTSEDSEMVIRALLFYAGVEDADADADSIHDLCHRISVQSSPSSP